MSENQVFLDEYLAASDLLKERGFPAVGAALRDMHARVVQEFCGDGFVRFDSSKPTVIDGHLIATDGRILIRMKTDEPDTALRSGERRDRLITELRQYLKDWHEYGEGTWEPWPVPCVEWRLVGRDDAECAELANRAVFRHYVELVGRLPEPEYLDDCEDYIGVYEEQPLRFRFRCGEGVVMPMRRDR